ncbi:MAG: 4'-phosphopantetheinyl transferase superfamily protein [Oscillospiraceae bacterium]|nr:4'-phosphopantetheinyl transferase superfamily protein [Oscillospiraceae bacterium]
MCKNHIYVAKIDSSLSDDIFNGLLQVISDENREKCQRFMFKKDALRTLYGELMFRHVLCQQYSFANDEIEILKGDEGKPYIKDSPVHFNVSHAGDFVVCAFSEHEVGVDIEQVKDIDLDLAKHYFCKREYEDLFAQNINNRLDYFYSLWTLKESYMKWLGLGMSIPLDSFCFDISCSGISVTDINRKTSPHFRQLPIEGYKLSICSMVDDFPDKIDEITVEEMCHYLFVKD